MSACPALIEAVTLDAANAAARRLLDPARATIAVAGPWQPRHGQPMTRRAVDRFAPSSSTSTSR